MRRVLLLLAWASILAACGDEPGGKGGAPQDRPPPPPAVPLSLEVAGPAVAGKPLPLRVTSAKDARITIRRATDPLGILEHHPDPDEAVRAGRIAEPADDDPGWETIVDRPLRGGVVPRLDPAGPGLYVVRVAKEGVSFLRAVLVPGAAVIARRSPEEVLVFVADPRSGRPLTGIPVVLRFEIARREGRTDGSGVFRTAASGEGPLTVAAGSAERPAAPVIVPAARGGGPGVIRMLVETHQPAHLPGNLVRFRAVPRDGVVPDYLQGETVFEAVDTKGFLLAEGEFELGPIGTIHGQFVLPPEAAPGNARLRLGTGAKAVESSFLIAETGVPEGALAIVCDPDPPAVGSRAEVRIRAVDRFGRPLTDAEAEYEIRYHEPTGPLNIVAGMAVLGADGTCHTGFDAFWEGSYEIRATVTDDVGLRLRATRRIEVGSGSLRVALVPEPRHCRPGERVRFTVRVQRSPDSPWDFRGTVRVGDRSEDFAIVNGGTEARVALRMPGPGVQRVVAEVRQVVTGEAAATEAEVWALDEEDPREGPTGFLLLPDRREYSPGQPGELLVLVPRGVDGASTLVTLDGAGLGQHSVEPLLGRVLRVPFVAPEQAAPRVEFRALTISDGRVLAGTASARLVSGERRLRVRVHAEPESARPGQVVRVRVEVKNELGEPIPGVCALSVYDAALEGEEPRDGVEDLARAPRPGVLTAAASLPGLPEDRAEAGDEHTSTGARRFVAPGAATSAFWDPLLTVGEDGWTEVQAVRLRHQSTFWRVRATVAAPDAQAATTTATIDGRLPVSVSLDLPPYLVEGDRAKVGATVLREETHLTPVETDLKILTRDQGAPLTADRTVRLERPGDSAALRADLRAGNGPYRRIDALLDAMPGIRQTRIVQVRSLAPALSARLQGSLIEGRSRHDLDLSGFRRDSKVHLRLQIHLGGLAAATSAAAGTPGESIRTPDDIAHRFVPGLVLREAAAGVVDPNALPIALGRAEQTAGQELTALKARQRSDGGWGWADRGASDPLVTALVARSLLRVRDRGDAEWLLARSVGYLAKRLEERDLSDRPALLAMAARVVAETTGELPPSVGAYVEGGPGGFIAGETAHLALTFQVAGEPEIAKEWASRLLVFAVKDETGGVFWGRPDARTWDEDAVECTAAAVVALLRIAPDGYREAVDGGVRFLLDARRGAAWKSSRDTAAACFALAEAALPEDELPESVAVRVRYGGSIVGNVRLRRDDLQTRSRVVSVPAGAARAGRGRLVFEAGSGGRVSFSATATGTGVSRTPGDAGGELSIDRTYDGQDTGDCERGDRIAARLSVRAMRDLRYVVVDCPVPAGFEPLPDQDGGTLPPGTGVVIRRDRVRFLIPRVPKGETSLVCLLHAVREGSYRALPATVSLVYDPEIGATAPVEPPLTVR